MTTILEEPPIMCSLVGGDYHARLAWIADLNADALRSHRRNELRLELIYAPEARDRVEQMIAQEQDCCAFLDFALSEAEDGLHVTITAPERARDVADDAFTPFLPKAQP